MVTSILLLKTERGQVNAVAGKLMQLNGVSEVYSVSGSYDIIAVIRVSDNERLAYLITEEVHLITGIVDSETNFAFRVYSRHDLESMFAVGLQVDEKT